MPVPRKSQWPKLLDEVRQVLRVHHYGWIDQCHPCLQKSEHSSGDNPGGSVYRPVDIRWQATARRQATLWNRPNDQIELPAAEVSWNECSDKERAKHHNLPPVNCNGFVRHY